MKSISVQPGRSTSYDSNAPAQQQVALHFTVHPEPSESIRTFTGITFIHLCLSLMFQIFIQHNTNMDLSFFLFTHKRHGLSRENQNYTPEPSTSCCVWLNKQCCGLLGFFFFFIPLRGEVMMSSGSCGAVKFLVQEELF